MKRLLKSMAIILTLSLSVGTIVYAEKNNLNEVGVEKKVENPKVEECYQSAVKIIEDYYGAINERRPFQLSKSIEVNSQLEEYLVKKGQIEAYIVEQAKAQKENMELEFFLLSAMCENEKIVLDMVVVGKFNYIDMEDIESGFSKQMSLTFDTAVYPYQMVDWYTEFDMIDEEVRSVTLEKTVSNGLISLDDELIAEKCKEAEQRVKDYFEHDGNVISDQEVQLIENEMVNSRATSSLNKTAICNYALNNARLTTPASGGSNVPYYDFSKIQGSYDCTNFVSHALLAGGATPYKPSSGNGWYYNSLSDRSPSWSGVPNLYSFLTSNPAKGPRGVGKSYGLFNPSAGYICEKGDIIQFYSTSYGNWRHSSIVTGYYYADSYSMGVLVTGRSGANSYNYNQKAEEIYAGESKRICCLTTNIS